MMKLLPRVLLLTLFVGTGAGLLALQQGYGYPQGYGYLGYRDSGNEEQKEGSGDQERAARGERGCPDSPDVGAHGGARHQEARKIEKRIHPVGPAGDEPVKIAKRVLGPSVEPSLFREARGKFNDDESSRKEKK